MIVNLKHVKNPTLNKWSDSDQPFALAYLQNDPNPNIPRTLLVLTGIQLFLQLAWMLLLLLSCFCQWCFENNRNVEDFRSKEFDQNAENFFDSAVVLQFCDCVSSVIITNKLQNITSWFNYGKHIKTWITVNNLYSISLLFMGVVYLVVLWKFKPNDHLTHSHYLMCAEGTITFLFLVFGTSKVLIVHKLYIESSSYIYLEQSPSSLCDSNSLRFSTKSKQPLPAGCHMVDILNV